MRSILISPGDRLELEDLESSESVIVIDSEWNPEGGIEPLAGVLADRRAHRHHRCRRREIEILADGGPLSAATARDLGVLDLVRDGGMRTPRGSRAGPRDGASMRSRRPRV